MGVTDPNSDKGDRSSAMAKHTTSPDASGGGWRERAQWKVPALFCNDWACLKIAAALREREGRDVFHTAYGAPACTWAGGRAPLVKERLPLDDVRRRFEAFRQAGMAPSLTFNLTHVAPDELADAYSNELLDVLSEFDGSAIVADENLARHIRATHPRVGLVASVIRTNRAWLSGFGGDEEAFYRRTLDLFDEVVIRCPPDPDRDLLARIADIAGACQVLVTQICSSTCHLYQRHTLMGEEAYATGGELPSCLRRESGDAGRRLSDDLMEELVTRGFCMLKVSGRDEEPIRFARNVLLAAEGDADPARVFDPATVTALKMMSLPSADPLMRTCLPAKGREETL